MPRVEGLLLALVLLIGLGGTVHAAEGGNPFLRSQPESVERSNEQAVVPMPGWFGAVVTQVAVWQRQMNDRLSREVRSAAEGKGRFEAAFAIMLASFLYGVFHAAGPGHGKAVVSTYFLSRQAPWRRGVAMSLAIALVQALSAIAIVGVFALLLDASKLEVIGQAGTVELVSYGLVAAIGIYLVWRAATGQECCDHSPHGHGSHDHGSHDHWDEGHQDHSHGLEPTRETAWQRWFGHRVGELPAIALAVGLRPCTGAIVVLLFTLANGLLGIGILAVLCMGLGVAVTVAAIGIGAIGMRRVVVGTTVTRPRLYALTMRSIALAGALFVTGIGIVMFMAALQRGALI